MKHNLGHEPIKQPFRSVSGYDEARGDPFGSPRRPLLSPHFQDAGQGEEVNSSISEGDEDITNLNDKQVHQLHDRTYKLS